MKKTMAMLLALVMCLSLCACGASGEMNSSDTSTDGGNTAFQNSASENKTPISTQSTEPASTEVPAANTSYESILKDYTQKMKDALPGLVSSLRAELEGIDDIEQMAAICNDKTEDLAKICNEGIEEMAALMLSNGDAYDVYEKWAEELMNAYTDDATEIQNAYLDAATN